MGHINCGQFHGEHLSWASLLAAPRIAILLCTQQGASHSGHAASFCQERVKLRLSCSSSPGALGASDLVLKTLCYPLLANTAMSLSSLGLPESLFPVTHTCLLLSAAFRDPVRNHLLKLRLLMAKKQPVFLVSEHRSDH